MPQGEQVKNGKTFEYALAYQYFDFLKKRGINVVLVINKALSIAKQYYHEKSITERKRYDFAAQQTIDTMLKLEPGLLHPNNHSDCLYIALKEDKAGENGDVRDIVFWRCQPTWAIGFSAKNNNDAVKHSRLSNVLDFGNSWIGVPCSENYWKTITPIFDFLEDQKKRHLTWSSLGLDKSEKIYKPLLLAFKNEILKINQEHENVPEKLVQYLIGKYPFYKIIKDDNHNLVIVKSFNINSELNKSIGGVRTKYKTSSIDLPTRIVEFDFKQDSDNTLLLILDGGWEISFRIHNASTYIETSLKFDIKLIGNPPILFTQHLFQD